jgi:hypothetical protein
MADKQEKMSPEDQEAKKVFDTQVAEAQKLTTSVDPEKKSDPQKEPLGANAEKPAVATSALAQEGANRLIEGARNGLFGDTTSARGAETIRDTPNVEGLHGRDGGFRGAAGGGGPNNPAPNVDGTDGQDAA